MKGLIEQKVREFIVNNFLFRDDNAKLTETTSFLETGLIDSTGVLELVAFLEQTFAIKVADDEIVPENLDSIQQITSYLMGKLSKQPTPGVILSHAS